MADKSTIDAVSRQIYSDLFPLTLSKSDKRRIEIIEGAIRAYASVDFQHVSYDDIAEPAKTSRRLVRHYFPDKDELFAFTMKVVRARYQALVVDAISKVNDPSEKFEAYVRSAVSWPKALPKHTQAWILYFLVCSQDLKLRKLHEELAQMGEERIKSLVSNMYPQIEISPENLKFVAKTAQRLITGGFMEICSESVHPDIARVENEVLRACRLAIADVI